MIVWIAKVVAVFVAAGIGGAILLVISTAKAFIVVVAERTGLLVLISIFALILTAVSQNFGFPTPVITKMKKLSLGT